MKVAAYFTLPDKHADDMRQAIGDGDHGWILELLHFATLIRAGER